MAAARNHLDRLVRLGRITGWGFERSISYLGARHPTLSYRMYRGGNEEDVNLGAFVREIAPSGARIEVSEAEGSIGTVHGWSPPAAAGASARDGVWRSQQVVLTISFASEAQLCRAVEVVVDRFTRDGAARHHPGSWWVPDARVSGTPHCPPGMVPAHAFSRPTGEGHAVVLSPGGRAPFPHASGHPVFLPARFGALLRA
ncbi:MAG: hypothetical protein M3010_03515 [Candidatus Dormibacteraeota bacterium]|nr:hypothetical protein [Candidatus Dormibacteraeota bacterium]